MTAAGLASRDREAQEAKARAAASRRQAMEWKRERSAERATKLAAKLRDPILLLECLNSYLRLEPGAWTPAEPVHELTRGKTRKVKNHCTAARRILGVMQAADLSAFRLPLNWRTRLEVVGGLEGDIVGRAKAYLRGELKPAQAPVRRPSQSKGDPVKYKPLHEALKQPPEMSSDDSFYYFGDADFEQESNEPEFNLATSLQQRIKDF